MKQYQGFNNENAIGLLDFSHLLDSPAGKYGYVEVRDGHFYLNSKRIRFFGVNLAFSGSIPDKDAAVLMAERFEKNGINMVRLHHIDSCDRIPPGFNEVARSIIDYQDGTSQKFNGENLDRLDFLFNELKKRGIYIHIDLFVRRAFLPGDSLDYNDDLNGRIKNVNIFNRRLIELQKKFIFDFLTHKNPYTGIEYRYDPAIAIIQLVNENSMFTKNEMNSPSYYVELNNKWNNWLLEKYKNDKNLKEAWKSELENHESIESRNINGPELGGWGEKLLDIKEKKQIQRSIDEKEFLMEIENCFIDEMRDYLDSIGVKQLINISNLPLGLADLKCVSRGDVLEHNAYWNHPSDLGDRPKFHDYIMSSMNPFKMENLPENIISRLSTAKVEGKPFLVSEWNACYPTKFRSDIILMLTAYANLQDWDGLLLFSYTLYGESDFLKGNIDGRGGFFDGFNDPAIWGLMGLCSEVFQKQIIKTSTNSVKLMYSDLDCLSTNSKWVVPYESIPFISKIGVKFTNENKSESGIQNGFVKLDKMSYRDTNANQFCINFDKAMKKQGLISDNYGYLPCGSFISDTGEIIFDYSHGVFSINTDKFISLSGKVNGRRSISCFKFDIENKYASLSIISKDKKNIDESKNLLLVCVGECIRENMQWDGNILLNSGNGNNLIDEVRGSVVMRTKYNKCNAYALDERGCRVDELKVSRCRDGFKINLDTVESSIYFELQLL